MTLIAAIIAFVLVIVVVGAMLGNAIAFRKRAEEYADKCMRHWKEDNEKWRRDSEQWEKYNSKDWEK